MTPFVKSEERGRTRSVDGRQSPNKNTSLMCVWTLPGLGNVYFDDIMIGGKLKGLSLCPSSTHLISFIDVFITITSLWGLSIIYRTSALTIMINLALLRRKSTLFFSGRNNSE